MIASNWSSQFQPQAAQQAPSIQPSNPIQAQGGYGSVLSGRMGGLGGLLSGLYVSQDMQPPQQPHMGAYGPQQGGPRMGVMGGENGFPAGSPYGPQLGNMGGFGNQFGGFPQQGGFGFSGGGYGIPFGGGFNMPFGMGGFSPYGMGAFNPFAMGGGMMGGGMGGFGGGFGGFNPMMGGGFGGMGRYGFDPMQAQQQAMMQQRMMQGGGNPFGGQFRGAMPEGPHGGYDLYGQPRLQTNQRPYARSNDISMGSSTTLSQGPESMVMRPAVMPSYYPGIESSGQAQAMT